MSAQVAATVIGRREAENLDLDAATLQRARQGRELDGLARAIRRAVGLEPELLVVGPALEELALTRDAVGRAGAHREATLGVADRRPHQVLTLLIEFAELPYFPT